MGDGLISSKGSADEGRPSGEQVIVYEVEVPAIYTADLDGLREYVDEFGSESEWLLNCLGEPGVCRLRVEISGEKDSEVVEVWGDIRTARLSPPSPGVTDAELAKRGGFKLCRDEDSCEWCDYDRAVPGLEASIPKVPDVGGGS